MSSATVPPRPKPTPRRSTDHPRRNTTRPNERIVSGAFERCLNLPDIDLAVEEVLTNITHYAYPEGSGEIELCCGTDGRQLFIEFTDWGIPFDVSARPDPELSPDVAQREVGGLGIYLVKQSMDDVAYRRELDRNVLTLTVRLPEL